MSDKSEEKIPTLAEALADIDTLNTLVTYGESTFKVADKAQERLKRYVNAKEAQILSIRETLGTALQSADANIKQLLGRIVELEVQLEDLVPGFNVPEDWKYHEDEDRYVHETGAVVWCVEPQDVPFRWHWFTKDMPDGVCCDDPTKHRREAFGRALETPP